MDQTHTQTYTQTPTPETATRTRDVIDAVAGIAPGSAAAALRARRPELTAYAQGTLEALLEPADPGGLSRREREMVALRVAVLTPHPALATFYRDRLRAAGGTGDDVVAIELFPACSALSPREEAILRHVDLLTTAPRDAERTDIDALRAAGLGTPEIVTLSQLIAFLSFQVRVLHAVRLFDEGA